MPNLTHPTQQLDDAQPASPQQPPKQEFIHNFSDLEWQTECEPPLPNNSKHPQLYYLLTIFSQTVIGYYPHDTHTMGDPAAHYIAWAPLTASPTLTLH